MIVIDNLGGFNFSLFPLSSSEVNKDIKRLKCFPVGQWLPLSLPSQFNLISRTGSYRGNYFRQSVGLLNIQGSYIMCCPHVQKGITDRYFPWQNYIGKCLIKFYWIFSSGRLPNTYLSFTTHIIYCFM